MAITEFEVPDHAVDSEEEQSPLDVFKSSLHGMVIEVESSGQSALGHLQIIRDELKTKRITLLRESSNIERELRFGSDTTDLISELSRLQEEQIMVYHQSEWLEGYFRDRFS
jgi:hypothetical protein